MNIITGGEGTFPHVTQSETQVWAAGNTVVSAYNDSRTAGNCYSGGSYSTNGGATCDDLNTRPFCSGHGTGFGDPVVMYDQMHVEVDRRLPRLRMRRPGARRLDVERRRDLGHRPVRPQQ